MRRKVFVGYSLKNSQTSENILSLTVLLFTNGFLPVVPLFYEGLAESREQYQEVRLQLLKECQSAVWLDEPTEEEKQICVELGIATHRIE